MSKRSSKKANVGAKLSCPRWDSLAHLSRWQVEQPHQLAKRSMCHRPRSLMKSISARRKSSIPAAAAAKVRPCSGQAGRVIMSASIHSRHETLLAAQIAFLGFAILDWPGRLVRSEQVGGRAHEAQCIRVVWSCGGATYCDCGADAFSRHAFRGQRQFEVLRPQRRNRKMLNR
jgi:hypothetical protein